MTAIELSVACLSIGVILSCSIAPLIHYKKTKTMLAACISASMLLATGLFGILATALYSGSLGL